MIKVYRKMLTDGDIDPKFFNMVSQFAHFWTMFGITTITMKIGKHTHHVLFFTIVPLVLQVIYAAWHEFWYDPTHENPATRGSDLEDFAFLVGGALMGIAVEIALP
jgi:VanZ family protein